MLAYKAAGNKPANRQRPKSALFLAVKWCLNMDLKRSENLPLY